MLLLVIVYLANKFLSFSL